MHIMGITSVLGLIVVMPFYTEFNVQLKYLKSSDYT